MNCAKPPRLIGELALVAVKRANREETNYAGFPWLNQLWSMFNFNIHL
jgi:hypothetical protein